MTATADVPDRGSYFAPGWTLGFAAGCLLSSAYGFLQGAWPFGVVELIWAGVALRRWRLRLAALDSAPARS